MRDTDRDRRTQILVRTDGAVKTVADLRGSTVALGAKNSPQATMLPIHHLHEAGVQQGADYAIRRHDVLVGKHGDHVGGELDALLELLAGTADAAAVLDLNWDLWSRDGTADPARVRVLTTTSAFDHCNFTITPALDAARAETWTRVLLTMDYTNPDHTIIMDVEGLKQWLPSRTSGYAPLEAAVREQDYFAAAAR